MRKTLFAASIIALTVAVAPACATKKFVRGEVGNVNTKVDTLSGTVEQTQERTRQNETRIGAVDAKAEAAGRSATDARSAATEARAAADAAAARANAVGARVDTVSSEVAVDRAAARKLIYEVTINEAQGNFKFGGTDLPDQAKARLDQMVSQLKTDPKAVFIEIEGHTDNVGGAELNHKLGLERAEAVKRYLYEQHQVPLHKINVISYGEDKPVAPNNKRDNRAQNRRVVIKVLS
jgi:outer membrane protein OmpA-like peptidoglycan-associated protein